MEKPADSTMAASFEDICFIFGLKNFKPDPKNKSRDKEFLKPVLFTQVALIKNTDIDWKYISGFFGRTRATLYNSIKSVDSYCLGDVKDRIRLSECQTIVRKYYDRYFRINPYYNAIVDSIRELESLITKDEIIPAQFIDKFIDVSAKYNIESKKCPHDQNQN